MEILGVPCRVIHLDLLIETNAATRRARNRAVEMELRAIRDRQRGKSN
ncbi:MAG: hypothetical protein HY292_04220 [Planctomycetes bacterium]|nr:hypothetical protein [Planctomycetota bacterium]